RPMEGPARVRLHDLLAGLDVLELIGGDVDVTSVTNDSRRVRPGSIYACIPGSHVDGHDFAEDAVHAGARALLVQRRLELPGAAGDVAQARVPLVRAALGPAASALFGHPSRAMRCLGVTGTNGKTTTTFLLEAITRAAGLRTGVIGTVGARVDGIAVRTPQITPTTPEAPDLQQLLAEMRDAGVAAVAMEVTSHGLARHEVDGTTFAAVCFTNLSHEHLDYHGTLHAYREAKARLFDGSFAPAAAVNVDDDTGRDLARRVVSAGGRLVSFGLAPDARVSADTVVYDTHGTSFLLIDREDETSVAVRTPLVGPFNLSNALAAAATANAAGLGADAIVAGLSSCPPVPGRMEHVERGQPFTVLVDYAHTPDALRNVLDAARALAGKRRVVAVFGAGGDRDREKRPLMGAAVGIAADVAVLTSDNPRTEPPDAIAAAVLAGLDGGSATVVVELDRRAAIRAALADAAPGDVVVIAGKGHETGQTIGDQTRPFDDRVVASEELEALGWT
ncbi:MAG: UDP-N-acetylmuramoyl-L-alanyl-D-glutamate--2,6-diaminopimelate ligase, partial [Acidimicrobiia bacterium]